MKVFVLTIAGGVRSSHSTHQKAKDAAQSFVSELMPPSSIEWSTAGFEALGFSKNNKYKIQITETTLDEV